MFSKIHTLVLIGLDAKEVSVEIDIRNGLFAMNIVGLAGKSVQEAKERVFSAIKNSSFEMPMKKITINLSPADLNKNSSAFDLPIAVGILVATRQIHLDLKDTIVWGEISLEGKTMNSKGALAIADYVNKSKYKNLLLPQVNANEARIVGGINIFGVSNIAELQGVDLTILKDKIPVKNETIEVHPQRKTNVVINNGRPEKKDEKDGSSSDYDFAFIKGQKTVKRGAEIAVAGGHNLLLKGVPGSGKTFLARCIAEILPSMEYQEMIEVTKIHSIAGSLNVEGLVTKRPFRSPHHTSSDVALIGGGRIPKPGEITLAHRGVLFLDEFNEFAPRTLESLRQPIEDKVVHISRANGSMVYPANFMLVVAMNPCKCGYWGDKENSCTCSQRELERFKQRISGPILDRIDLQVFVNKVDKQSLLSEDLSESSVSVKERVELARMRQLERFHSLGLKNVFSNAELNNTQLKRVISLDDESKSLLAKAIDSLRLSARGYFRLLKVARTIADLEGSEDIKGTHLTEALGYRIII